MSADLGPGTPLICIDGSNPYLRNPEYKLQEGGMYFVQRVYSSQPHHTGYPNCPRCGRDGSSHWVVIKERPHWGYPVCRFRPLSGDDMVREEAGQNPYDVAPPRPVFVGIDYASGSGDHVWWPTP